MINIEDTDKKVKQVDGLLTSITNLIKKHWLILIIISLGAFVYFALTSEPSQPSVDQTEEVLTEEPETINNENYEDENVVEQEEEVINEDENVIEEETENTDQNSNEDDTQEN